MIKTQEEFKIRMPNDMLTAFKEDILNNRISLPYCYIQTVDSSPFIIRHTFDNRDGDNVTLTSEKILKNEESCSKFNEYTDISDDFQHEIVEQLKNGKLKSPFTVETRMDTNGVRKEIIFSLNNDGSVLKKLRSLRTSKISYKVSTKKMTRIQARSTMNKFSSAIQAKNGVTMKSKEDIYITTQEGVSIGKHDIIIQKKKEPSGRGTCLPSPADMFKTPYKSKVKTKSTHTNKFVFKKKDRKNSILVRNLPRNIEEDEVRTLFKEYGRIRNIKILKYEFETKAFVNYYLESEAESAIEYMNGHRVNHMILMVVFGKSKR